MVIDGNNFASCIFGKLFNQGLSICCNPDAMYQEAQEYIRLLRWIGLEVKKVFVDGISTLGKMDTYLERRNEKSEIHSIFWSRLSQDEQFSTKSLRNKHIYIPNCCVDAVLQAFIDEYGENVISSGGIDADR